MNTDAQVKFGKEYFVGKKEGSLADYYDVVKKLGKGGYGDVHEIRNKKTGEIRAVKHLSKLNIQDLTKFRREIDFLVKTDHPNIIKLYEVFESTRSLYLVMEECKGGELFDRIIDHIDNGIMYTEKDAAEMILQVMSAIEYCHNKGICHRDLKPENLLYLYPGTEKDNPIKIIDFGLSQYISKEAKLKTKVGTAYYVSPEILNGKYSEKCDIWSIGVILYVLLSGDPPFNGPNDNVIYSKIAKMKYSFPKDKWENISDEAIDLISNMLKPENERYSASQVLAHPWFNIAKNTKSSRCTLRASFFKKYKESSLLKKMVRSFVASRLKENDIQNLKDLFKIFDQDNDGQISYNELEKGILKLEGSAKFNKKEIQEIFDSIDTDKNGKIDYTEFIAAALEEKEVLKEERLLEAFSAFDKNNSGTITKEQILKVLKLEPGNNPDIDEIIKKADKNGDGAIDYIEFLECMGFNKKK